MNLKAHESDVHEIQKEMVRTDPERQLIKKKKYQSTYDVQAQKLSDYNISQPQLVAHE